MIQFGYTILYVEDVAKSIDFYEKSFGFTRKFITAENDYAELSTGSTTLSFASIELANTNLQNGFTKSGLDQKPFGIEIGFVTDDVEGVLKVAVQNGAKIVEAPKQKPWGQTVAYLRDINGFLIEVCTAMK